MNKPLRISMTIICLLVPIILLIAQEKKPNILLVVADDMNFDSVGAFGSPVENVTPNLDKLAASGIRFTNAHVNVAVCQPSRGIIMMGLYGHQSGIEGFEHYRGELPTLTERLRSAGYETAMLDKIEHSMPKQKTEEEKFYISKQLQETGMGRDSQVYYNYSNQFLEHVKKVDKPFFFMVNSRDPHRPFAGSASERTNGQFKEYFESGGTYPDPSRIYTPDEIEVPGFLPDIPKVREEIAQYYSSVRRFDDTLGAILRSLEEHHKIDNTLIIFISDNGMAFPFAKTNCYLNSTKTPFIASWPGVISPSVDTINFISGVDFLPTFMEVAGEKIPKEISGKSFLPLLKGRKQKGRDFVFTQFYETSGKVRFQMRAVQDKKYGYIFNPWTTTDKQFRNESMQGLTFNAMKEEAKTNPEVALRVDLFLNRTLEEFYDFENDPNAQHNLINDPNYQDTIKKYRKKLRLWMVKEKDPLLYAFDNKNNLEKVKMYVIRDQEKVNKGL